MKNLPTVAILLIALFLSSCKNSGPYSIMVDITVLDQQGENLLASPVGYKRENIDIYYVIDGKAQLYNPNTNKGFQLFKDLNNNEVIRIDLNHDRKQKYPLTLVKFGTSTVDTLKAKFKHTSHSSELQTVWLNGVQKDIKGFIIIK